MIFHNVLSLYITFHRFEIEKHVRSVFSTRFFVLKMTCNLQFNAAAYHTIIESLLVDT